MSVFFRLAFADVCNNLRWERHKLIACSLVSLVGMVLGIVVFKLSVLGQWYCNRCVFVDKIVFGGFFEILLSYIFSGVLVSLFLCVALLSNALHCFCYVVALVLSFYFGANCCALFAGVGALGVLYLALFVLEFAANLLCCFLCACIQPCKRSFGEAVRDNFVVLMLQLASVACKMFIIFALLRIITTLI